VDLHVLGNSSRYLAPLGAGTSYLLTEGDARLLLDCGNGTHLRLAQVLEGRPLAGVVVSHFHLDNVADLLPVAFSLSPGTPLVIPQGAEARLADILRAYSMDRTWIQNARLEGVGRKSALEIGPFKLSFCNVGHGCPAVGVRVETTGGALVYLADTGPRPWFADFARGASALLCHTMLMDRDEGEGRKTNLSAGDAGRLARKAGVGKLLLSHVPFYGNAEESHAEAKAASGAEVTVLREGQTVAV
jgi:ribonuclease BN (tRNA processing enzyme)